MNLTELANDYTVRNVALGSMLIGLVSGTLGCFAVLRRQGLMGDTISHAALPGICLAFLVTGLRESLPLMVGAALAGWVGMTLILQMIRHTRVDTGSAMAVILSMFFGLGIVLLTVIQKSPDASQAGIENFILGQAAAMTAERVAAIAGVGLTAVVVAFLFRKEFKVMAFDYQFAQTVGFRTDLLEYLLTALLVVAIVVGLNTVGVILMSAMLIAPAAAARQWVNSLRGMLVVSAMLGMLGGLTGSVYSVVMPNTPTGPAVVLAMSVLVVFSLFFGSTRGLLWSFIDKKRRGRNLEAPPQVRHG